MRPAYYVRQRTRGSVSALVMTLGFLSFLIADGTPGGLDGMEGFLAGAVAGLALAAILLLPAVMVWFSYQAFERTQKHSSTAASETPVSVDADSSQTRAHATSW